MQEKDNLNVPNTDGNKQLVTTPQSVALVLSCVAKVDIRTTDDVGSWTAGRSAGHTSKHLQNTQSMLVYTTDNLYDTANT